VHGEYSLAEVLAKFSQLRDDRVLKSEELGWGQDKGDAQVQVCCSLQLSAPTNVLSKKKAVRYTKP
jgi:hypothetical protein